jgi:membrane protease YdiL (CAAX protease family)
MQNWTVWLQHVLVLFLVIGLPVWDYYEIPRLKASTEPRKKVHYYQKVIAMIWICTALAVLTTGLIAVLTIQKPPGEMEWLDPGSRTRSLLMGVVVGMLAAILLPAILAVGNDKIRIKAAKSVKALAFLLPSSAEERLWWWPVCLSAGICEEAVYRGFLLHYLHASPSHFSLMTALVASSLIFGVAHLYQGVLRAIPTVLFGFLMGTIFLATGNLLAPMVLHALLDLRVLLMLPPNFERVAETGALA